MTNTLERALIPMPPSQGTPLLASKEAEALLQKMAANSVEYHLLLRNSERRREIIRKLNIVDNYEASCLMYLERKFDPSMSDKVPFENIVEEAEHLCETKGVSFEEVAR
jgi:hypothetical protein